MSDSAWAPVLPQVFPGHTYAGSFCLFLSVIIISASPAPTLTSRSIPHEQQLLVRVEQPPSIPLCVPPKTKRTLPPSQVSHVTFESRPGGGLKRHSVTLLRRYLWQYTGNLLGASRPVTTAARNRPVDFHGRPVLKRCQAGAHRARSCYWVFGEGARFIAGLRRRWGTGGRGCGWVYHSSHSVSGTVWTVQETQQKASQGTHRGPRCCSSVSRI